MNYLLLGRGKSLRLLKMLYFAVFTLGYIIGAWAGLIVKDIWKDDTI